MIGMKRVWCAIVLSTMWLHAFGWLNDAQLYDLTGSVDGKYPVTIYLVKDGNALSGKYFYHSTIARQGVKPSSYLYIDGLWSDDRMKVNVYDVNGNLIERWEGEFSSGNRGCSLECKITNPSGKRMTIEAVEYF